MSDASGDSRWKQTLNLPRTDFPMKGNLTQLEPRILARWEAEDTYRTLLARTRTARASCSSTVLPTPMASFTPGTLSTTS